jgi:hypothetical protein
MLIFEDVIMVGFKLYTDHYSVVIVLNCGGTSAIERFSKGNILFFPTLLYKAPLHAPYQKQKRLIKVVYFQAENWSATITSHSVIINRCYKSA